jgi:hypothetical protein
MRYRATAGCFYGVSFCIKINTDQRQRIIDQGLGITGQGQKVIDQG